MASLETNLYVEQHIEDWYDEICDYMSDAAPSPQSIDEDTVLFEALSQILVSTVDYRTEIGSIQNRSRRTSSAESGVPDNLLAECSVNNEPPCSSKAFQTMQEEDVCIAVMGVTGAGKSSFIQTATGYPGIAVGNTLNACTQHTAVIPVEIENTRVYLIDTPGFDDTYKSDTEILRDISTYLATHYRLGGRLSGLIYLHPISENRMRRTSRLSLEIFQELCGAKSLGNVILASTMWDLVPRDVGEQRETQLTNQQNLWGNMVEHGSKVFRHDGTRCSALQIIRSLMSHEPTVLKMQYEVVNQGKDFNETDCAKILERELSSRQAGLIKRLEWSEKWQSDLQESVTEAAHEFEELIAEKEMIDDAHARLQGINMEREIAKRLKQLKKRIIQVQKNKSWWKDMSFTAGFGAAIATAGMALEPAAPMTSMAAGTALSPPAAIAATEPRFISEINAAAGVWCAREGFAPVLLALL